MQRKSGPNPQSSSDTKLPHAVSLDREVWLKSAMLTLWEREMPELFEYAANKVFFVYNAQNGWSDIVEAYSTQYYPVLKRLEKLGEQLLQVQSPSGETQSGSEEERARTFDTIAQPLSAEFAEILQSAAAFLPDMVEKNVRASLKGIFAEHEKGAQILGSASSRHWTACLDGLIQLKQRICALGLIEEGEVKQVDLGELCARLAKGMPATRLDASDDPSSCIVQAPSQLTEAVMMVLGREILGVALELRERIQRSLHGITVFDIGTAKLESKEQAWRAASLVTGGELLKATCSPDGCLSLGIPVPQEDFDSLAWLRERVGQVVKQYRYSVDQLGGALFTDVGDYAGTKELDHKEYRLSVQFQLSDAVPSIAAPSHSLEEDSYSVVDDEWFSLVSSSLLQRTPAGRSYYMSMNSATLKHGRLKCDSAILSSIESIVDALETVDSVRIQTTPLDAHVLQPSAGEDAEGAQEHFDTEYEEDESDSTKSSDRGQAHKAESIFVFCADRMAIQQINSQRRNSIQGTFKQLKAVASMGLQTARVIPDRPLQMPPYARVGLPASFLGDRDLMEAFLRISARCNIGEFVVVADTSRAKDYLNAAQMALDEHCANSEVSERLTLQLRSSRFLRTNMGLVLSPTAFLQIISPTGAILAEGAYSPTAGVFEMITIPQAVMQPLTEAIVEALNEQLAGNGVLRLVPLAQAIENRSFHIPDKVLLGLFLYFKALQGRAVGSEMEDRVRGYLQSSFKQIKTHPPKFEGGVCSILSDDELPPAQRSSLS